MLGSTNLISSVCKSPPACCYLSWSCLFVVCRWSHRLRAGVWGAAGGYHLPRGVAGGKDFLGLPGQSQSTCHIQVTYVPNKPCVITTHCAFCVPPTTQLSLTVFKPFQGLPLNSIAIRTFIFTLFMIVLCMCLCVTMIFEPFPCKLVDFKQRSWLIFNAACFF